MACRCLMERRDPPSPPLPVRRLRPTRIVTDGPSPTTRLSSGPSASATRPAADYFTPRSGTALQGEAVNSRHDTEDPLHQPLIDQFRERHGLPPGGRDEGGMEVGPSDAEIKYCGYLLNCPVATEVAQTTDLTTTALAAGRRTAYGILAQMRVLPDCRSWNGTRVSETLRLRSSTCPETLTRGDPCSGSSTFVVGGPSGTSPMLPAPMPGARNHFWDFHVTNVRPPGTSALHDPARNPQGLDRCSTVCEQEYSCDGNVIGRHTVTRTFSKSVFNGNAVTLVTVTKT